MRLEPLDHRHRADLTEAATQDRGSYGYTEVPTAEEVGAYIGAQHERAATGRLAPYAQIERATGRAVGATAYGEPRVWPADERLYAVEVGFTWRGRPAARRRDLLHHRRRMARGAPDTRGEAGRG